MLATRINTALGLLITGGFLITAQFFMLSYASITRPGIAGTVLTSQDAAHTGLGHSGTAGCHEESAPKHQVPVNHDCCTVGHLHAIGSAPVDVAFAPTFIPVNSSILLSASIDQTASQTIQISDTGPPGSAVPIRV